ncbi:helix-turn-helix domain-containing protein [Paenibacillus elgii]|uniref:helix-turn-helix domain-containing protein n=1 Tax=Paenibacillus elgii TaxID=189691 RepID=UPI000248DEDB|nr:helix-turn-helix transcriptional regulator [Paenibacillus elgii]
MKQNLFGDFIRDKRKAAELGLRDIAKIARISFSQLSKIERGESTPSKETVEKLAHALKADKDELMVLAGYISDERYEEMVESVFQPTIYDFTCGTAGFAISAEERVNYEFSINASILRDKIFTFLSENEQALDMSEVEMLADEMRDFYVTRRRSLIKMRKKDDPNQIKFF